jgi:branched-chain amino acid transport system substrate-binding protein
MRWFMLSMATLILLGCTGPTTQPTDALTDPINTTVVVNQPNDLAEPVAATALAANDPQTATATPAGNAAQNDAARPAADGTPIKIGSSLALTGPFGPTGSWIERGYQHWAEEINGKGGLLGRPVELIILDDGGKPEVSVSNVQRLITEDKVELLLGGYPGPSVAAQMPLADQYKMVYVSMGGHMASFTRGYQYTFGAPPIMGQWWYNGVWEWMKSLPPEQRPQKAAIITMNNPIGAAVMEGVDTGLDELNVEVVMNETFELPLKDPTALVEQAKATGADLFISNGTYADGIKTTNAMKALGYNPQFFMHAIGVQIPDWSVQLHQDGNYVLSGTPIHEKLPFDDLQELTHIIEEKYNLKGIGTRYQRRQTVPEYFLFGYAWAQMLQRGIEGAGSFDQTAIQSYLKQNEIRTIGGTFAFDERGLPKPYAYAIQVINGKAELIWPEEARSAKAVYPKPPWE